YRNRAELDVAGTGDRVELDEQGRRVRSRRDRLAEDDQVPVEGGELLPRLLAVLSGLLLLGDLRVEGGDVLLQARRLVPLGRQHLEVEDAEHDGHQDAEHDRLVGALHPQPPGTALRALSTLAVCSRTAVCWTFSCV